MGTEVRHPDAKMHQIISFIKSGVRIGGSLSVIVCGVLGCSVLSLVIGLAISYGIAELIGVYEELV